MLSADAVVVGAGIIGASISWRLAQAGLRVVLLDRGKLGNEASWAGAGMLAPGGELAARSAWSDFALESLRMYAAFVVELEQESGCPVDYQAEGAVEVALDESEWRALDVRARAQREMGIASSSLDRSQLREVVPLLGTEVAGARFFPQDALVDPRDIMQALRRACERRGVQIREGCPAAGIHADAGGIRIQTESGELAAGIAVLAAGAWSGGIPVTPHAIPDSFPIRGHLVGHALEPGSLGPILRRGHTYLLQRKSGFTVAGTSEERVGFDHTIDPGVVDEIRRRAIELLPCLEHARPEPWTGFRPATASLLPEIRRLPGAPLWLSYGHYRNGILLAPATAKRVAEEISASWGTGSCGPSATGG